MKIKKTLNKETVSVLFWYNQPKLMCGSVDKNGCEMGAVPLHVFGCIHDLKTCRLLNNLYVFLFSLWDVMIFLILINSTKLINL